MLKQNLSQRMLQKLSPQQIQLMKLLQIPTATLDQRIKEELEANPALEEGEESEELLETARSEESEEGKDDFEEAEEPVREEEFELEEYLNEYIEDDPSSYKLQVNNYSTDEEDKTVPIAVEDTFHEYLEQQMGMIDLKDERELIIAEQIIGSIDDDGYLRREPSAIIDDLMFAQNINASEEEILCILKKVQRFDPPGTGARDLQECLSLQLGFKIEVEEDLHSQDELHNLQMAKRIIDEYFNEFSKKHFQKLQRYLGVSEMQLKQAIDEILKLNPKPASGYEGSGSRNM